MKLGAKKSTHAAGRVHVTHTVERIDDGANENREKED
jgi:hypothetical protein